MVSLRFLFATSNCFCVFILFFKRTFRKVGLGWLWPDPANSRTEKKCLNLALFWSGENHPRFLRIKLNQQCRGWGREWEGEIVPRFEVSQLDFYLSVPIGGCGRMGQMGGEELSLSTRRMSWGMGKVLRKGFVALVLTGHSKLRTNLSDSMCEGIDTRFF